MNKPPNIHRCRQLIENAVKKIDLDLSGLVVLTEAASGYYLLTSLIAALSHAQKVYALTRDSRFGLAKDIVKSTLELSIHWQVESKIEIFQSRTDKRISQADIVTNLGFIRPLDKTFISRLKKSVVIPLMWATWEWRPAELDLMECRKQNIPVLGTNENHGLLNTFDYIGYLALKLLLECDIEIIKSKILIIGSNDFAVKAIHTLSIAGATVYQLNNPDMLESMVVDLDAIVVVEHHSKDILLGSPTTISFQDIYNLNKGITIVHICGNINTEELKNSDLKSIPELVAPPGVMSVTTDYLGPKPLIDLHTAGLKVGEALARNRSYHKDAFQVEIDTLNTCAFAQGFEGYH